MRWVPVIVSALAFALFSVAPAGAQFYVGVHGGGSLLQDADNSGGGVSIESQYDAGLLVGGTAGFAFPMGLRVEGEISYHQNEADRLVVSNDGGVGVALGIGSLNGLSLAAEGDLDIFSFLANGAYDFDTGTPYKPYVLAGLGFAVVRADISVLNTKLVDDAAAVFAWQIGAGLAYAVNKNIDVFLDYRYFATADPTLADEEGDEFDTEVASHNIAIGLRYRF